MVNIFEEDDSFIITKHIPKEKDDIYAILEGAHRIIGIMRHPFAKGDDLERFDIAEYLLFHWKDVLEYINAKTIGHSQTNRTEQAIPLIAKFTEDEKIIEISELNPFTPEEISFLFGKNNMGVEKYDKKIFEKKVKDVVFKTRTDLYDAQSKILYLLYDHEDLYKKRGETIYNKVKELSESNNSLFIMHEVSGIAPLKSFIVGKKGKKNVVEASLAINNCEWSFVLFDKNMEPYLILNVLYDENLRGVVNSLFKSSHLLWKDKKHSVIKKYDNNLFSRNEEGFLELILELDKMDK